LPGERRLLHQDETAGWLTIFPKRPPEEKRTFLRSISARSIRRPTPFCGWCWKLDGEVVERVDPHIGLLHRGTEKADRVQGRICKALPYFDRLDYVAPMNQEHAFALAIERLADI